MGPYTFNVQRWSLQVPCHMRINIHVQEMHNYNSITRLVENALYDLFLDTTMYSFSTRLHEDTDIDDSAIIFGIVNINIGNG